MPGQNLRWWSASQLDDLASRIDAVTAAWASDWSITHAGAAECSNAHTCLATDGWRLWDEHGGAELWYAGIPDDAECVRALFGSHVTARPTTIAAGLAAQALQDWRSRFGALLPAMPGIGYRPATPPAAQAQAWSGAVRLTLPLLQSRVVFHLGPALSAALMREPVVTRDVKALPALTSLQDAVARRNVPIQVRLDDVEIDLGALQGLAVGDVIRLDHRLDQPLRAESADGSFRCAAWLGRRGTQRAIELARHPSQSTTGRTAD